MKLTTTTHLSLDGVMQGCGGPDEDRSGGFERGGWITPFFDAQGGTFIVETYQRAEAFLFGRRTYELFAGYWGTMTDRNNPIAAALNTRPKYVTSRTLTAPQWDGTTVISSDVAATIRKLKAQPGRELQVHGSGELIRWLIHEDLVDEINLLLFPVIVGQGRRLFASDGPDVALHLLKSQTTPAGVTIQTYRPAGRPRYATAGAES
ncbi:dihydrofolate reductase family protein [Hoyosella sp. YIM 151337]|uniref:dihydrofolate reductase family protein n=1 Tax=Hoyosella sp. YIM 151337 TaxID=2992742 RepID=UPI002236365C|nr:dihydrofolate reductase family protein [Hoyosella sp. YIM 151337]MCW4352868.1 dihydrofolate reductase family protein [Hoyosella sp. YIM 151337]